MARGRTVSRRRRLGALFMLVGLLTGTFSFFGPQVLAEPIGPGTTIGDFEIEGNFAVDNGGKIDWAGIPNLADYLHLDDPYQPNDPPGDEGFTGGAEDFDRSTWGCAADAGKAPPQSDIDYVLAYPDISLDEATVAFSYVRTKGTGTFNVSLELNRGNLNECSTVNDRTPGDLLLQFDYHGSDEFGEVFAWIWTGSSFTPFDVPAGVVAGTTNPGALTAPAGITTALTAAGITTAVAARGMGETAIDLVALQAAIETELDGSGVVVPPVLSCPGIGVANIRTRASDSHTAQLKDLFPDIPIDLSNCGSLKLKKVDDLGQPMEGIQFGLFASEAHALAGSPVAQLPTDPPQPLVCTTDAAGVCEFPTIPAGDYFVNEINLPDGYTPDPDLPKAVHIDAFTDVDWTDDPAEWFENTLRTGSVVINKVVVDGEGNELDLLDNTYLDGITFELQSGGVVVEKRGGGDATCTLVVPNPDSEASCQIDDVPLGTYDVVEDPSTLPAGLAAGPSVSVTVDEDSPAVAEVDYENPADPLNLSIDKAGPNEANVGDIITYEFNVGLGDLPFNTDDDVNLQPLTDVEVTELINLSDPSQLFDDRCDVSALALTHKDDVGPLGDAWLEDGEVWTYSCQHLVTMAEATDSDGTELWNRAQVEGTDRFGRTDTDTDDHLVTILLPDITVEKTPDDGVILPGEDAVFTIEVTNLGPGRANDVTIEDELPDGIDWSVDHEDCEIDLDGTLTCAFDAPLEKETSVTVTVTGTTDIDDCGELPNTATVSASNEPDAAEDNNSDDGLITVSCADVTIEKVAKADPINAGDVAAFDITVTNLSSTASATDVTLEDQLPEGIDWSVNDDDCDIDDDGTLTCDFGTLGPEGTVTVTVSGETDPADCGLLENTATVSSSNEAPGADDNNESSDDITVECPNVWVDKSGPASVNANDTITWTITFGNDGEGDAYDVTLSDELPTSLTGYVLGGDDADLCDLSGTTVTCSFDVLEAGAEHSITVTGTTDAADCGDVTNPVSIVADNEPDSAAGDNQDSATTEVQCPDIDVTKVADDDVVSAGEDVGFTITVSNGGPGTAYGVTLDDPLPAGDGIDWSVESQTGGAGCAVSGDPGAQTLSCGPVDLEDGESFSVHITSGTQPTEDVCEGGELPNTATADADNDDPVQASDTITVECPDIDVTKVADDDVVSAGEDVGFTITVSNGGPGTAYGVTLDDPLPAGDGIDWSVESQTGGAGCAVSGDPGAQTLSCGPVDLEEGEEFSVHVTSGTQPTGDECVGGELPNTATADADNDGPVEASDTIHVLCPGLNVVKDADDEIVDSGEQIGFTILVTNAEGDGVGTALGVTLDDSLPAGDGLDWSIESQSGGAGCEITGPVGAQVLSCGPVDLAPGASFSVHVVSGTLPSGDECIGGEVPNTATADATNTGPESDDASVTIQCPDVSLEKAEDAPIVDLGDEVGFTISVSNAGPGAAFDVEVTDDLPGGFDWSIADDSDLAGGSCQLLIGMLSCGWDALEEGAQATIHLTAPTVVEDVPVECADVVNVATATVGNGTDPDDSEADLRVRCPIEIQIEKDGPATALVGEEITYTFEVTNTGGEDLFDVVLTDPICDDGTFVWLTQGDGDEILEKDGAETWTAQCTRVIQESDPDPLPNTATVVGHDEWDRETDDSDDHEVDILHPAVEVTVLEPICDGDVPYLQYAIGTTDISDEAIAEGVDITFLNPDGDDFSYTGLALEGRVLWPGAEVDENGDALDWPGWTQQPNGQWVEGDEWDWVRPEVDVLFAVNPEVTVTAAYPESSPLCDGPPPEVAPQVIPRPLPRTGAETQTLMLLAGGLLLLGGLLVVSTTEGAVLFARRRRSS